jgi:hypothetical protein
MATRVRKRPLLILLAVVLVPVVTAAAWRYHTRALPFDSARWRSGDAVVRYRMKEALRAKYDAGELGTRDAVDAALGPDDDREDSTQFRQFLLKSPGLGFPWYVHVGFDDSGKVTRFIVTPQ